ncbi:MAG: hypothetical protein M1822_000936 [Bathelium mastoideum]|nr:MAG: hypothetical protein M1822_000936 [Bathelium mastoideum]
MTTKDTSAFKSIDSAAAASVTPPRPQSYAAPESWSKIPVSRVQSPSRLGVLPSPARSTFTKLCDTESEGKDEITEQAILDSIVRNASPPPISLPNSRGLHKKSPKNGESEKPNQNVSAISLLPSQQRSATESKKQRADPELYSSRNASSTHSNLTDAQADARPALRETPRVEEPSPPTDTRNNMVSEETSARPSDNTEKAVRRTSGSDLSPPVEALRAEGPIRTQRSSVSSIDVEPSKDKLDPKDSSSPRGFTHRRQVSALDDEGNVSSEVKATSNSHNTNSSKSERLPANNGGIDTQVSPLHSLDANSQPSPEARNRAQQYFARSIPDRPSSPPVHPALRDSYDEFALQDKPQRYQYHEDQSLSHASANTSVRQPMLYPSSPQDARQGYDQAGPRSQNESGYQSSQHPPHQSEVRYGPFPPQTQDGSRQYAPNEMSGPPVAVTSDAMQQRPVDRSSISTTPVQFQRPSPQRRMSPGVNAQLSSTRYRQPSGDLSRDFPNGPGYSQGDSGPSTNPSNVPSGAAGQYRHSGAPLHTHISAPASASPVQEHQARGYFRGPTNSSIAPNSRPSAWESIGAQRSEVRRDERYASGPLGAATNPRVDDATQDATLRRAATSSKTEGGKKKRFSMLGNLFSRSGSTGHAPKQTNKLTKVKSSRRSQALPASPSVQQWAQGSSAFGSTQYPTITAPVAGPRGTESMTFGPEWQRNAQSRGRAHQPQSPPAEGYYAPSRIRESETIHPQGAPVQNYYGVPQDQYDAAGPPTQSYFEGHSSPPRRTSNSQSPIWPSSQDTNSFPSRSQSYNTAYSHQQPPRPHPRHSSTSSQQYPLSPATTTTSASLTTPPLDSPSSHSAHVVSPLLPTTNPMLANPSFAPPHAIYAPQQAPEYQRDQRAYQMQQQEQHQQQGRRGGDGGRARGRWGSIGSAVGARAPLVRGQYEGQQQTPWELQMPEENVGRMERRDEGHGGYGWQGQGQRWQGRHESQGGQGYARGRRVGEEEVVMRGASYPGQEWAPEGLAHGWD